MADIKTLLVAGGFDPSFIDKVIADFAADAPVVLQLISDFKSMGFGVAWIADLVQTAGPAALQLMQDLRALFSAPKPLPAIDALKAHASAKIMKAAVGAHPFLDWLIANAPALVALILKLLGGGPNPIP
jgi:hypothetical protein